MNQLLPLCNNLLLQRIILLILTFFISFWQSDSINQNIPWHHFKHQLHNLEKSSKIFKEKLEFFRDFCKKFVKSTVNLAESWRILQNPIYSCIIKLYQIEIHLLYVEKKGNFVPCSLLICTLISENQGLEKSRSVSNLRKFSGPKNWILF